VYDVVVTKFTFAISSPDEFLVYCLERQTHIRIDVDQIILYLLCHDGWRADKALYSAERDYNQFTADWVLLTSLNIIHELLQIRWNRMSLQLLDLHELDCIV